GVFSEWNGHRPTALRPRRRSATTSETTSLRLARSRTARIASSRMRPVTCAAPPARCPARARSRRPSLPCARAGARARTRRSAGRAEVSVAKAAVLATEGERHQEDEEQRVELVHALPPGAARPAVGGLDGGAGRATQRTLARGHRLLLPSHARLLVVLALAQLS